MSETDSFIDEVSEEVRKDKLYATMRKYGWLAVVIVLTLVGGTAFREYKIASANTVAQKTSPSRVHALLNAAMLVSCGHSAIVTPSSIFCGRPFSGSSGRP